MCKDCGQELTLTADHETHGTAATRETAGKSEPTRGNPPAKLGRFEIHSRLGAGAFGTVYRAYDPVLDREVALKVPRALHLLAPDARARFLREPKAAAQLRHPHIVPVFEAGRHGKHFYIASAYIEGSTLSEESERGRIDLRSAAEVVRQLAEALQYAHQMGVVHRDVKPLNVMMDRRGGPMLMDFGLARIETAEDKLTQDGSVMGTPAYMSPEQADSSSDEVGPASDQYSLGVVLYELLAGEPPFEGTPAIVIFNILNREPLPLRERNPEIPRDLATICLKAMAKRPTDRYSDCQQFADDLSRWLKGEPVHARPIAPWERFGRWCIRNPVVAGLATTAMFLLLAMAVIANVAYVRTSRALRSETSALEEAVEQRQRAESEWERAEAEHHRAAAERERAERALEGETAERRRAEIALENEAAERQRAEAEADKAKTAQLREARQNYYTTIRLALARLAAEKHGGIPEMLRDCPVELRGWEWGHIMARCPPPQWEVRLFDDRVKCLSVSANGKLFAASGARGGLAVWSLDTNSMAWCDLTPAPVAELAFNDRTQTLLAAGGGRFLVFEAGSGNMLHDSGDIGVRSCCLATDGRTLFVARQNREHGPELQVYDTGTWELLRSAPTQRRVNCLAAEADGRYLAAGEDPSRLTVFDTQTLEPAWTASVRFKSFKHVVFDSRRERIVCGAWMYAMVYDVAERRWRRRLMHGGPLTSLVLDPVRGKFAFSSGQKQNAKIAGVADGKVEGTISQGTGITCLAFLRNKGFLTGDREGTIRLWRSPSSTRQAPRKRLSGISTGTRVAFRPDGEVVAAKGWTALTLWDTATWKSKKHKPAGMGVRFIEFRPGSAEVAITFKDSIRFFNVDGLDLEFLRAIESRGLVHSGNFDASGRLLAVSYASKKQGGFDLFDVEVGQNRPIDTAALGPCRVALSDDGQIVAAVQSGAPMLSVWETRQRKQAGRFRLPGSFERATSIAFHPGGKVLAIGGSDGIILLWDVEHRQALRELRGHTAVVANVEFSRDGRRLLSGSYDQTVRIWDWELGKEFLSLNNSFYYALDATFSHDGLHIASTDSMPFARVRTALDWTDDQFPPQYSDPKVDEFRKRIRSERSER